MIRFAWLQSRTQTLVATAALSALGVVAAITGVHLSHLYNSLVTDCQTNCGLTTSQFLTHGHVLDHVFTIVAQLAAPLIGIFWGAPLLSREIETGTFRLAWTQSVSRSRWLVTKLTLVGLVAVTVAGLLSLTITWWYRVFDPLTTNQFSVFDERGITPIGYAAFAFACGAFLGAVIRRTLPAMAATIVAYAFARIAITLWVRPYLLSPVHKATSLLRASRLGLTASPGSSPTIVAQGSAPPNAWTVSSRITTGQGHVASTSQLTAFVHHHCPSIGPPPSAPTAGHAAAQAGDPAAFQACMNQASHSFHLVVAYVPADRYWTLQWLETGVFLGLTLVALLACYLWVTLRSG